MSFSIPGLKKGGLLLLAAGSAHGQYLLGVTGSNYAGTNALSHNPAQVVDSRHKLFVNLITFDEAAVGNTLAWKAPYSLFALQTNTVAARHRAPSGLILWRDEYLGEATPAKPRRALVAADLRGPSVLYTFNDRFGAALSSRLRVAGSVTQASAEVARIIRYGTAETERVEPQAAGQRFAFNLDGTLELGATFGAVVLNSDVDFVKAGITVKRLVGLYSGHVRADNLRYRYVPDPTDRTRENILIENVDGQYGFTDEAAFQNFRPTPQTLFGRAAAGAGWGFDLGLVYEFRPDAARYTFREKGETRLDPTRNKYRFRLSLALLDVGGIRYRNPAYVRAYEVSRTNRLLDDRLFGPVSDGEQLTNAINQTLGVSDAERLTEFRSALPTTFQASFDYKIRENVYLNGTWVQRLRSPRSIGPVAFNVLALTPRYERKWFEAALPLVLVDDYRALTFGLALRLGPVFLGSDHLPGLLNIGAPRGLNAYVGAHLPLFRQRPTLPDACYYEKSEKRGWRRLLFWKRQ